MVILALQASASLHLGVDNLNVVRHLGRLLDGVRHPCPSELVKDGDFIFLIDSILRQRERDTVRVIKVKRHADEDMVQLVGCESLTGLRITRRVRLLIFGRRRVSFAIDARRDLYGLSGRWYPVIMLLHRFFIAISRAVGNHCDDEGTAPDPLVWSACALPKRRWMVVAVRVRAVLPGTASLWTSEWVNLPPVTTAEDVGVGPHSVGILV